MKKEYTPGPWKALREYEYFNEDGEGIYYDPEPEDIQKPYVKIGSAHGTIVTNHDLFEFKNQKDAQLIALAPEMAETIEEALNSLTLLKDESIAIYILEKMLNKIKN